MLVPLHIVTKVTKVYLQYTLAWREQFVKLKRIYANSIPLKWRQEILIRSVAQTNNTTLCNSNV